MPVVGVDDVGEEADLGEDLQRRFGEESEALGVVKLPVGGGAPEVIFIVE